MSTTTQAKWFYKAQSQAGEELHKRFKSCICNWQIVTKDRIVEQYSCSNELDEAPQLLLVTIVKHGSAYNVSAIISTMSHIQSWHVS